MILPYTFTTSTKITPYPDHIKCDAFEEISHNLFLRARKLIKKALDSVNMFEFISGRVNIHCTQEDIMGEMLG